MTPVKAPERLFGSLFRQGSSPAVRALRRDRLAVASIAFLILVVLASLFAPFITPYAEQGAGAPNIVEKFAPPSATYWFGTDQLGRDVLARVLYGGRTSLLAAFGIVFWRLLVAQPLGLLQVTLAAG